MEQINAIVQVVKDLGFPIVVCWLIWQSNQQQMNFLQAQFTALLQLVEGKLSENNTMLKELETNGEASRD